MTIASIVRARVFCALTLVGLAPMGIASAATSPSVAGVWEQVENLEHSDLASLLSLYGSPALRPPHQLTVAGAKNQPAAALSARCIPAGMPQMMLAVPAIEIVEVPGKVVIFGVLFGEMRHLYLDEKIPPLDEITATYGGYSVARWEGRTLVVETRGVREDVQFLHVPHSANMKITERIRMTARGTLENSIVISDPAVLAKPYAVKFEYRKAADQKMPEHVCDKKHSK